MGRATSNGWLTLPHVASAEAVASQPQRSTWPPSAEVLFEPLPRRGSLALRAMPVGWDSTTLDMHHGFIDLPDLVNLLAALGVASRMRPPRLAGAMSGSTCDHSPSVRSLG